MVSISLAARPTAVICTDESRFFAIDVVDLTDRPGFPVLIDGHNADNDPTRYFIGGTVLQRPSLTLIGSNVYGTFGGHCDLFNYTGMIVAVSTKPGVGVTSLYGMEMSPGAPPVQSDITKQVGGRAGIWMSGMRTCIVPFVRSPPFMFVNFIVSEIIPFSLVA